MLGLEWQQVIRMASIEELEEQIRGLSRDDLARIRELVLELDWELWDQQIEDDSKAGKLDALAEEAMTEHRAGRTRQL